jgi:hypothetical protein
MLRGCGLAVLVGALGLGCKVDDREVQITTRDGGEVSVTGSLGPGTGGDGNGPTELAPGALGAACQQNTECDAGNCVDGICCDSPCTELCAACNVPGSVGMCSAAPRDALCPEANCRGESTECRPLAEGQAALNCEAVGVCRASAECVAPLAPAATPCQQGTGTCDGQGACLVPDKNTLGEACELDGDCAEGHCVSSGQDGARVCCDAACDGVCQACSSAGRCEGTPATDARCEAITCPADNVCRDYVEAITDNLCRSFGQCRSALDCGTAEFFTSLRPSAQCVCDPASGDCALAVRTSCAEDGDCASGACVQTAEGDRVCCSGPCAAGLFCSSTGTGCVQCEGSQIECDGNVQRACDAGTVVTVTCPNGCTPATGCNDLPPVGFLCSAGQCAPGGVCQQDTGGQARCCVRNCAAEGRVCSATGSCECPPGQTAMGADCLLRAGDPCQSSNQCQAGLSCVDGVCCQEACGGYCERCQASTGLCSAIPAGQQESDSVSGNSCTNGFECTGQRNGCRARTGQSCSSNDGSDCVSANCEPTAGGGASVCCSQACSGVRDACRSTGQGCVECETAAECGNGCNVAQGTCNALRAPGATCSVSGQCSTNRCVPASDGSNLSRCCPNCAAGQLCTAQGQCVNRQSELGGNCGSNADCRIGVCSSGVCCTAACDPTCEACGTNGACQSNGVCDAFDCIAPNPPAIEAATISGALFSLQGTPPAARGGTVRDGRYTPVRVDVYGDLSAGGFFIPTYELRGRSAQIAEKDFFLSGGELLGFLPAMTYTGVFATSGVSLTFDVELCDVQFSGQSLRTPSVQYTATANGLATISQHAAGTLVISYARQ